MVVGHLHVMLFKCIAEVFSQAEEYAEIIGCFCPAENTVLDGAFAVVGQIHGGLQIVLIPDDEIGGSESIIAGSLHGFGGGIVGSGDLLRDTAAAQSGVVDDLGAGQFLIGQQNCQTVGVSSLV